MLSPPPPGFFFVVFCNPAIPPPSSAGDEWEDLPSHPGDPLKFRLLCYFTFSTRLSPRCLGC